jgi:hypothetical protein
MSGPKPGPTALSGPERPRLAEVKAFPGATLNDVPRVLRAIADRVEAGDYGAVEAAVLVIEADDGSVRTFGAARADYYRAYALLSLGIAQLVAQRADRLVEPGE